MVIFALRHQNIFVIDRYSNQKKQGVLETKTESRMRVNVFWVVIVSIFIDP